MEILESFVSNATQVRQESMATYVNWMVAYEFPALSALAIRLDGVGKKVHDEELSLYIRRKDVLNVVKEMELKSLENMVLTMRKRLLKHFKSEFDLVSRKASLSAVCVLTRMLCKYPLQLMVMLIQFHHTTPPQEMRLVEKTWQQLKDRVVTILGRLEEAASLSYQIKLEVGPVVLNNIFDRVAGLGDKSEKGALSLDFSRHSTKGLDASKHSLDISKHSNA